MTSSFTRRPQGSCASAYSYTAYKGLCVSLDQVTLTRENRTNRPRTRMVAHRSEPTSTAAQHARSSTLPVVSSGECDAVLDWPRHEMSRSHPGAQHRCAAAVQHQFVTASGNEFASECHVPCHVGVQRGVCPGQQLHCFSPARGRALSSHTAARCERGHDETIDTSRRSIEARPLDRRALSHGRAQHACHRSVHMGAPPGVARGGAWGTSLVPCVRLGWCTRSRKSASALRCQSARTLSPEHLLNSSLAHRQLCEG